MAVAKRFMQVWSVFVCRIFVVDAPCCVGACRTVSKKYTKPIDKEIKKTIIEISFFASVLPRSCAVCLQCADAQAGADFFTKKQPPGQVCILPENKINVLDGQFRAGTVTAVEIHLPFEQLQLQ